VLPLENLSRDPEQEYFADGLTDDIITELGCLSPQRLGVIARTSAMQYKRTTKGIGQIGRELGVDYIVEGTARRDASRVRITAQLIRVSDQTHAWAHGYERQLQDVLLLQSELASAIAAEVRVQLVPQISSSGAAGHRVNPEAYETCLKARFFWNRRTRDDLYRALELFSKSIERDPDYAPAFAGMADTYLVMLDYRYMAPNEALAMATAASVNALRLDERLADAHTSLARAKLHALDWDGAEQEFRRSWIRFGPFLLRELSGRPRSFRRCDRRSARGLETRSGFDGGGGKPVDSLLQRRSLRRSIGVMPESTGNGACSAPPIR
jgi:TolB-like protein